MPISYKRLSNYGNTYPISFLNLKPINYLVRLLRIQLVRFKNLLYLKESSVKNNYFILNLNYANIYLDGYWQNPTIFYDHINILRKEFIPNNLVDRFSFIFSKFSNFKICSIHVRRGDYLKLNKKFTKLTLLEDAYFFSAINKLLSIKKNIYFFVFSDDTNYCKKIFSYLSNVLYIGDLNLGDLNEFYLMSLCNYNIISNSTFSWWAAFLNNSLDKLVFAPKKGWIDSIILPNDWIKL
jgi:hypothetical protein